jgi:hypothetical protein
MRSKLCWQVATSKSFDCGRPVDRGSLGVGSVPARSLQAWNHIFFHAAEVGES